MKILKVYKFIVIIGFALLANGSGLNLNLKVENPKIQKFVDCLQGYDILNPSLQIFTQTSNLSYYNILNRQWNLRRGQKIPLAYFIPKSTFHVQFAVICGQGAQLPLIPNSGGHSYEAISYGDDSTVIIDFRDMNKVEISEDGKIATMQPGLLLGPMLSQLWSTSKVSLPVGNCLSVGLGGHAVGGGEGYYSARYGLLIDNILEYEMVDADGNAVIASSTQNPDLFWGIRGMGAGYLGIITSVKAQTFRADKIQVTTFLRLYPTSQFTEVMAAFQSWMDWVGHDYSVFSEYYIAKVPSTVPVFLGAGIHLFLVHIHDPNDLSFKGKISRTSFIRKARQIFPKDFTVEKVVDTSYIQHAFLIAYSNVSKTILVQDENSNTETVEIILPEEETILQLMAGVRKEDISPVYFKEKSMYVKRKLHLKEINRLSALLPRVPANVWITVTSELGRLSSVNKHEMAFVHRDSLISMNVHFGSDINDIQGIAESEKWLEEWWSAMQSFDGNETYQNFPDLDIPEVEAQRRYFGSNLAQIVSTKRRWDLKNYFKNPISIPLYL